MLSQAIKDKIESCKEECETRKERLEIDINGKHRQLDLLNTKISSLNDPRGVESTIEGYDAEYKRLQSQQRKEEGENTAKKKAVNDEIRNAFELAKEYEAAKRNKLNELNSYIGRRKEECEKIKLLDS